MNPATDEDSICETDDSEDEKCECCDDSSTSNTGCPCANMNQEKRWCKRHRVGYYGNCTVCIWETTNALLMQVRDILTVSLPKYITVSEPKKE